MENSLHLGSLARLTPLTAFSEGLRIVAAKNRVFGKAFGVLALGHAGAPWSSYEGMAVDLVELRGLGLGHSAGWLDTQAWFVNGMEFPVR